VSGDFGKYLLIAGIAVAVLYLVYHVTTLRKFVTGATV
jgi:hypothetical protein